MAIRLEDEYANVTPGDSAYPGGSFKNASTPTSVDGTHFEKTWANDFLGFFQALITAAGITPSGAPDTATASQYKQALEKLTGQTAGSIRNVAATGPVLAADRIIVIDAGAGNINLTLLSAADANARVVEIYRKRSDPGTFTVTLLPDGAETIAGDSSVTLLPGEGHKYIPDGVNDYIQA